MKRIICAGILSLFVFLLAGCTKQSEESMMPLLGLEWYNSVDEVKEKLSDYSVIKERENKSETEHQQFIDYSDAELLEQNCDLTLCFSEYGLIGINYHDVARNKNFREWNESLQQIYGVPTEQGNGMASWYKNPVGKNTAMYLFNLEEGVQISFYVTSSTPDQSYEYKKDTPEYYVPVPEIRTPIIPVEDEIIIPPETGKNGETIAQSPINSPHGIVYPDNYSGHSINSNTSGKTDDSNDDDVTTTTITGTANETTTTTVVTEPPKHVYNRDDFLLDGLKFYISPQAAKQIMSDYIQTYEYEIEEKGEPWELVHEYENIIFLGKNCDSVMCFTSIGLVGINYFDSATGDFNYWKSELQNLYGPPDDVQYDYVSWSNSSVGNNITIYVFLLEDGVQISFFTDDSGSEIVK